jgi:hypothetical protein
MFYAKAAPPTWRFYFGGQKAGGIISLFTPASRGISSRRFVIFIFDDIDPKTNDPS